MLVVGGGQACVGRFLGGTVGVADLGRAETRCSVDGRAEIAEFFAFGLDQEDPATGADRMRHLHVDRDLAVPFALFARQRRGVAGLVHLAKAAVGRGARRQAELLVIDRQVGFGGRVVERVDERDRLTGRARGFTWQLVTAPRSFSGVR